MKQIIFENTIYDYFVTYRIIRQLTTPFNQTKAYKLGLMDDEGNIIRKPLTGEEKDACTRFDVLIWNIKKLISYNVLGKYRLANYVTGLMLLKEGAENLQELDENDLYEMITDYLEEIDNHKERKKELYDIVNILGADVDEDAPANSAAAGHVAGVSDPEQTQVIRKKKQGEPMPILRRPNGM